MKISTNEERTKEYLKKFNREKVLRFLLKKDMPVIFDIGSNDGQSLKEFKSIWPKSYVHCFEPQLECIKSLESIVESYDKNTVFINKYAAGNKNAENIPFFSHDLTSGQSGFNRINLNSKDSLNLKKISNKKEYVEYTSTLNKERLVKVKRLENYLNEKNIKHIDILKIDTQGYEIEVLEGLGIYLSNVSIVLTELMFYDFYEKKLSFYDIEKHLDPNGLKLYDISHISKNPLNGRTDWVDIIYVNQNHLN